MPARMWSVALCGAAIIATVAITAQALAQDRGLDAHDWSPAVSERLVQLPARYLDQAIDDDFSASTLAQAIGEVDSALQDRQNAIGELQEALPLAEGDAAVSLRRDIVAEKKAFLDLMERRHGLRRHALEARRDLLEKLLAERARESGPAGGAAQTLVANQQGARHRFAAVDAVGLIDGGDADRGRYGQAYAANDAAMRALTEAIAEHPLGDAGDPGPLDGSDTMRELLANTEADLSLLAQEERLTGLMARLVALDAQALAATIERGARAGRTATDGVTPAAAVSLFTNRFSR
ncbi:MAG: hypothetical protein HQ495_00165 [Alphaproteobacteria bacterium]|nr:hypothetical protein [Alphaproteobacteria bacterium]